MSSRRYWRETKDPIYGYTHVTEAEKQVVDSFPLRSLRRIRQLAGSEHVYPGANHTRFERSLVVMYLAGLLNRVHTEEEHLGKVQKASKKLFGDPPFTMRISY